MELLLQDYHLATLIIYVLCTIVFLANVQLKVISAKWFKIAAILIAIPPLATARMAVILYPGELSAFVVFLKNYLNLFFLLNVIALIRVIIVSGFKSFGAGKDEADALGILIFTGIVVFISTGGFYEVFVK